MSHDMEITWVCDRCGAEEHASVDPKLAEQPLPLKWRRFIPADRKYPMDICMACRDALELFLSHPEADTRPEAEA